MKKSSKILFLIVMSFTLCVNVSAKYHSSPHYSHVNYFSVNGSLGYSTLIENFPELNTLGGLGGHIGFGYELRTKGFWLNTGLEFQFLQASSTLNISGTDKRVWDTQGKEVLYHYNFDTFHDSQRFCFANVPLLLGYYYYGFYVGAGAKIGYAITASESCNLKYSTSGTYSKYLDDFEKMANHDYSTYSVSNHENLGNTLKFSVIGEIGYDILAWAREANKTEHHGLKIGAFAEYGFLNIINSKEEKSLYEINDLNASQISLTPFYCATASVSHKVVPLYAGLKVSWIFCIKTKHCDCNIGENTKAFYKRYRNIQH